MDYSNNEFARILDSFGNELKDIILPNGKKFLLALRDGHYVISARDAYVNNIAKLAGYSLKCTGMPFNPKTWKRELCNADLTPYCLDGNYYFRAYQNANEVGNIHTPHNPFCPYGLDLKKKSIEWITSYKMEPDAMQKSFMECLALLQEKNKIVSTNDSSSKKDTGLNSEKNGAKSKEQVEAFEYETKEKKINPKSCKDFWFAVMNAPNPSYLKELVMTPFNYKVFRSGEFPLNGIKTLMAKRCSYYNAVETEIVKQLPEVARLFSNSAEHVAQMKEYEEKIESFKKEKNWKMVKHYINLKKTEIKKHAKPIILEDPFSGEDSVIIVLVDRLPEKEIWKHLSKRTIKQEILKSFVLGAYSEDAEQKEYPSDYFTVMSNWKEYTLTVDEKSRKLVVGEIYALGRQIDYFLEQDLEAFKGDLN